jgi:hypothetical protein
MPPTLRHEDFDKTANRRARVILPFVIVGLSAPIAYFGVIIGAEKLGWLPFLPPPSSDWRAIIVLPAFVALLGPMVIATRRASRITLDCPSCGVDLLARGSREALFSARCPSCDAEVLERARPRPPKPDAAEAERQLVRFLSVWGWCWPALSLGTTTYRALVHSAFAECPQAAWAPAAIGLLSSLWIGLRTPRLMFAAQFVASGAILAWHAWQGLDAGP